MRCVGLVSAGKDSTYAMMCCRKSGHQIVVLANLHHSTADDLNSFMFQTVGQELVELFATACRLPLQRAKITGTNLVESRSYGRRHGDEVEDLYELLRYVRDVYHVEAAISGAILSHYQRLRVENVCRRLGLKSLAPLWRRNQQDLLDEMINSNIAAVLIKVASLGLDGGHLGRSVAEMRDDLSRLAARFQLNPCGEGGEFETATLDCPLFYDRIVVRRSSSVLESNDCLESGHLVIEEAGLEPKSPVDASALMDVCYGVDDWLNCCGFTELARPVLPTNLDNVRQESLVETSSSAALKLYDNGLAVGSITLAGTGEDALENGQAIFDKMAAELIGSSVTPCALHVYVSDMNLFGKFNIIYSNFLATLPGEFMPSRICLETSLPTNMTVYVSLIGFQMKKSNSNDQPLNWLHVESISHWAPANIGPYSQVSWVDRHCGPVFVAGQIPLVPWTMMPLKCPLEDQRRLCVRHVNSCLDGLTELACLGDSQSVGVLRIWYTVVDNNQSWSQCCNESDLRLDFPGRYNADIVDCVFLVNRLPRDVLVELEVSLFCSGGRYLSTVSYRSYSSWSDVVDDLEHGSDGRRAGRYVRLFYSVKHLSESILAEVLFERCFSSTVVHFVPVVDVLFTTDKLPNSCAVAIFYC